MTPWLHRPVMSVAGILVILIFSRPATGLSGSVTVQDEPRAAPAPVPQPPAPAGDVPPPPVHEPAGPAAVPGPRPPAVRPREAGPEEGFPFQPWPLLRYLRERRPDLADRLERLRERDPERFRRVILDAFVLRLEEVLAEHELEGPRLPRESRGPEGGRPPVAPGPGEFPPGPAGQPVPPAPDEFAPRVQELHRRHDELEMRSRELGERCRRARIDQAPPEERERLRAELERTVNEQFDVRTELRHIDLQRIERELQRLHERVESLRRELERRQRERGAIIERRIDQLLGEEGGW